MAAISSIQMDARDVAMQLAKRNWASQEAGVIVVFAIVFIVAVGVLSLCISRAIKARKVRSETA
jgi:hypothetical protein